MLDRQKYLAAATARLEPNILNHSLALEACMGGIYDHLSSLGMIGADEPPKDDWLLAGLVHDIDYCGEFKETHPQKTRDILAMDGLEISDIVDRIVKDHDARQGAPANKAGWAIRCADSLTGLITAVALILPSKKLADVKLSSVMKRLLKEPKFAAGTRREEVALCQDADKLNIPLETFAGICLAAMQKIAIEIGL